MTTYNKTTLKTFFENGDVPNGQNYSDLIDSQVNIVETALQVMGGPLSTTELITPRVSAAAMNITGTLSANDMSLTGRVTASAATFSSVSASNLNVATVSADRIHASAANFTATVSANNLNVAVDISAGGTVHATSYRNVRGNVSALGTTQASAATINMGLTRCRGVTDGSNTGFIIPQTNGGVHYIFTDTVSANLYPATGGVINALSTNAPFPLAASTAYVVFNDAGSHWAVK